MSMADLVEHRRRALAAAEPAPAPTCDECGAPLAEWEETTCRDCDGGGADQECVGSVVTLDDGSSRFMVRR
jgi:hypothetical protein